MRRPTRLRRPWRRFNIYRHDWKDLAATALVIVALLLAYTTAEIIDEMDKSEAAAHLSQLLQWHAEANLVALLNGEPLVDRDTHMALTARIESYP